MGIFSSKKNEAELLKILSTITEENNNLKNDYAKQVETNNELVKKNKALMEQLQKVNQISKNYDTENKKLKEYSKKLEEYSKELKKYYEKCIEELKIKNEHSSTETKEKCFTNFPIIYQNPRKTSLETWIDKLEKFISSKSKNPKYEEKIKSAKTKLKNCRNGLNGENSLKDKLFELRNSQENFKDMIIMQDLCFKSPFKNTDGLRENIQIDFLVITKFLIFIFDSKYRTGVEIISKDTHITKNMSKYRAAIIEIISQSGLKEEFGIKDKNIYPILVFSGKNELKHAGVTIKSTDSNSGHCEECDEIKYIFNDNLISEITYACSHAQRNLDNGFNGLSPNDMHEIANSILYYICENGYDYNLICPICNNDLVKKSGINGYFLGHNDFKSGCNYTESI